ncbi:hypothetical protein FRC19_005003 [Serendipita sp. 401]|nr:hypothetical protein FRC19_005003 [Serendipita sp. 401]
MSRVVTNGQRFHAGVLTPYSNGRFRFEASLQPFEAFIPRSMQSGEICPFGIQPSFRLAARVLFHLVVLRLERHPLIVSLEHGLCELQYTCGRKFNPDYDIRRSLPASSEQLQLQQQQPQQISPLLFVSPSPSRRSSPPLEPSEQDISPLSKSEIILSLAPFVRPLIN